jgi:uncharacterized protein (TIGR00730 family)
MANARKAYKNLDYLNSREARPIRILAEYMEPEKRFCVEDIKHTVVFFGSSRVEAEGSSNKDTSRYYNAAEQLAYLLASWSKEIDDSEQAFTICSGGGPGIMEASNRGASRAGAKTIGLNISIPYEQEANPYITPELSFEFHYFFMRKLWFLYHAKGVVFFPGGFGTLDELFETLTLIQTGRLRKPELPIILYDRSFWEKLINFDMMVDYNFISKEDIKLFSYFESPEEGFDFLKPHLQRAIENFTMKG